MSNYLDKDGLTRLWSKIKAYVNDSVTNSSNGKEISSKNSNYPDYTSYWRWIKYADGTFEAEYKRNITTSTLSESSAIGNLMTYLYTVSLPFTAVSLDVPKWDVGRESGLIWSANMESGSLSSIKACIIRAISSTNSFSLNVGCTVTGRWK